MDLDIRHMLMPCHSLCDTVLLLINLNTSQFAPRVKDDDSKLTDLKQQISRYYFTAHCQNVTVLISCWRLAVFTRESACMHNHDLKVC